MTMAYTQLIMRHPDLSKVPPLSLPAGVTLRTHRSGDEKNWEEIIESAFEHHFDFDFLMAHPEMVGLKTNQLVSMIKDDDSTREFYYTFTEDGYLESCTEHYTTPGGYEGRMRVHKFTWK